MLREYRTRLGLSSDFRQDFRESRPEQIDCRGLCESPSDIYGAIMHLFRLIVGVSLAAVGLVATLVAVYLIANSGGKSPYMYVVWGLGLSTLMLGLKSLPKKKKRRRESRSAGRSHGRPDDSRRDVS
jgi:hypothetical protein